MNFPEILHIDPKAVADILGYGGKEPDSATAARIEAVARAVEETARPRWTYRYMAIDWQPDPVIEAGAIPLTGKNIAAHLEGCHGLIAVALTLGSEVDSLIRAATIRGANESLLTDAAASVLAESYAEAAEALLRTEWTARGAYLTGRYSPGYGDLPLMLQPVLLRLLDAARAIGLTVDKSHIMLPRKSITALMGVADHPVTGKLAGCDTCALRGDCDRLKRGMPCGKLET